MKLIEQILSVYYVIEHYLVAGQLRNERKRGVRP